MHTQISKRQRDLEDDLNSILDGRKRRISISKLGKDMILIEGNRSELEFLGKLLLARSRAFKKDCGFQMGPRCAGNRYFKKGSKFGIYIHRLPCGFKKKSR